MKLLVALASEEFLKQEVIGYHAKIPPRRQERVELRECTLANPHSNLMRQQIIAMRTEERRLAAASAARCDRSTGNLNSLQDHS
jgi:hypothetical protein